MVKQVLKFVIMYMAAIVSIVRRCGLAIKAYHSNQHNKTKLTLYMPLLLLKDLFLIQLYISFHIIAVYVEACAMAVK